MRFAPVFLLLLTVSGIWYILVLGRMSKDAPVESKTLTSFYGKGFFSPHGGFRIEYPGNCIRTDTILTCSYPEGSFVLQPEAGGHDAEVIKRDEKTMGTSRWNRSVFLYKEKTGVTYGMEKDGTYFVLEVTYDPYTPILEAEAEGIISTFVPMNSDLISISPS